MIGETILHYKILEKLGEGGMGVVYKAEDTKLQRPVALKFLSADLLVDKDAKQRFIQEARAASALDHPNIITIYDICELNDGETFISMSYSKGEILSEIIKISPIDIERALNIALQIAQGLEIAHKNGIIHRDIKPGNIMVRDNDRVKILDFGLAKLSKQDQITKRNIALGTVAYLSPEYIMGEELDFRTDIWSFGVLLYEMLAGRLPFDGIYDHTIMYQIVNEEPESLQVICSEIPDSLNQIVTKLLEKNREMRYQSFSEIITQLDALSTRIKRNRIGGAGPQKSAAVSQKKTKFYKNPLSTFIAGTILISLLLLIFSPVFIMREPIQHFNLVPFTTLPGIETNPNFSPDGNQIAYTWNGESGNNYDIYVKKIEAPDQKRLTDHPGIDYSPAWSPDGRSIAFARRFDGSIKLYIIPAQGGMENEIPNIKFPIPGIASIEVDFISWSADGKELLFCKRESSGASYGIFSVNLQNNTIKNLTSNSAGDFDDYFPSVSPDGKMLAFVRYLNEGISDLYIQPYPEGNPTRYTFDDKAISDISWINENCLVIYSNRSGNFAFWKLLVNEKKVTPLPFQSPLIRRFAISATNNTIAVVQRSYDNNIWQAGLTNHSIEPIKPTKFIYSTLNENEADYSPDGQKIVFRSNRTGQDEIWICDNNGGNAYSTTFSGGTPRWSPDSRKIAVNDLTGKNRDIYIINLDTRKKKRLTYNEASDSVPSWSRDGQWIYFRSGRSGFLQIYKIRISGGNAEQITQNGGFVACESMDSKWIYYSKPRTNGIWKIPVKGGNEILVTDYPNHPRNWIVFGTKIFFMQNYKNRFNIEAFDETTHKIEIMIKENGSARHNISISPDGEKIIYTKRDKIESDIYLLEGLDL